MNPWDDVFERALREHLPLASPDEPISPDVELVSLGADSAALLGLMVALENAYRIEFPMDQLNDTVFSTAGSLWTAAAALRQ